MSMTIGGSYQPYNTGNVKKQDAAAKSNSSDKKPSGLSKKAEALLERLKKEHGDMDFMVVNEGDDPKELAKSGTKEFSVLLSAEELEKMASDSRYEEEVMHGVDNAVRMSKEINQKYGFQSGDKGNITTIGIHIDDKGIITYFAELQQTSQDIQQKVQDAREEKAEEKTEKAQQEEKDAEKAENSKENSQPAWVKRVVVTAVSSRQLLDKMNAIDWDKVPVETPETGDEMDFSV